MGSSSRPRGNDGVKSARWRRAARGVVGLGAVAILAALVRSRSAPRGPVLLVRALAPGASSKLPAGDEDRATALAVASSSPSDRAAILELMDYTTARLEARLSPLGTDFGDGEGEPVEQFRRAMAAQMPSFTAARELERGAWHAQDLAVRVASTCEGAEKDETCLSLWSSDDGPTELGRRARFLAWAASRAALVDLGTPESAEACARRLRERTRLDASTIALVLTLDDLALRPVPDRALLETAAHKLGRAMAANDIREASHLESFARATPTGRVAPWLVVPPTAVVVVPRLSAIARPEDLTQEIESAAAGAPLRWLHHP